MKTGFFKKAAAVFMAGAMAVSLAAAPMTAGALRTIPRLWRRGFTL